MRNKEALITPSLPPSLQHTHPPTYLMRRWSPVPTPCWRCCQMCRDSQTREDGDVVSNTAADKKSQSQLSRLIKARWRRRGREVEKRRRKKVQKSWRREAAVEDASMHSPPASSALSQTPFPHWLVAPFILIGLTFTNTILIMTQQNASGAGHVVTGCWEVY